MNKYIGTTSPKKILRKNHGIRQIGLVLDNSSTRRPSNCVGRGTICVKLLKISDACAGPVPAVEAEDQPIFPFLLRIAQDSLVHRNVPCRMAFSGKKGGGGNVIARRPKADEAISGTVLNIQGEVLEVQTPENSILLLKLQPEGKNIISAHDFANGQRLKVGDVLKP